MDGVVLNTIRQITAIKIDVSNQLKTRRYEND